ncbi:hypothetical protein NA78x_002443 [Anatilimnocola sp. NA78]|uniref:hypothetical protein n=1 Tax=Anatilimnocola sp. NA78 TaxID=3415683 RepID=UPI003CE475B2
MRIFLAGIMQGSHLGAVMHYQGYRGQLRQLLEQHLPHAEVYDPLADHQLSLDYTEDRAREVFLFHNRLCGQIDVLIAFVPEASMGTAIEMWEAWRANRVVIAISPLTLNWTIKYCSHAVYTDLESFQADLASGGLAEKIAAIQANLSPGRNDARVSE